jgi:small subunit ribosomal protein S1
MADTDPAATPPTNAPDPVGGSPDPEAASPAAAPAPADVHVPEAQVAGVAVPAAPPSPTSGTPGTPPVDPSRDPLRDTYRPTDNIDTDVEAALADVSMDDIYASNAPTNTAEKLTGEQQGKIVSVASDKDDVMIDLGGIHQGVAPLEQWDGRIPAPGEAEAFNVERYDEDENLYLLNRKGKASKNATFETLEHGQIVEALVTGVNKGGLECRIGRTIRAFMPSGQIDVQFHKDISVFLNEKVQARIQKLDKAGKNVVLSRRFVVEQERRQAKQELLKQIEEGDIRHGTISNVMDFGAFVDLGGTDGLLHVSEMTFRRHVKPSDIVKKGDHVEVKVLKIDPNTGKISLSLRAAMPDPWENAREKYAPGGTVTARVTKVTSFGAFLEVEEGLEGLLPMSEMSYTRIRSPKDAVSEGETVRVVVLTMDENAKKLTFSLKQVQADPWSGIEEKYTEGSEHKGKVTRVADFGAFVELEPAVEGLVHISELSDKRVRSVADEVREGQEVTARVLSLDPETRRLRLSLRSEKSLEADAKKHAPRMPEKSPEEKKARDKKLKKKPLRGGLEF